eukprot:4166198-Pyramimonas_sp.AAC.2
MSSRSPWRTGAFLSLGRRGESMAMTGGVPAAAAWPRPALPPRPSPPPSADQGSARCSGSSVSMLPAGPARAEARAAIGEPWLLLRTSSSWRAELTRLRGD